MGKRELVTLLSLSSWCYGWAALPGGATGLSAVCDCGISWSYSLTIFGINDNWATHCQKFSNIFDRNMAARGWDQFFSYVNIGITLKKIFLSKSTWPIENNSTLMVIEWPSTKIVHIFIGWKTWLQGVESVFLIWKNLLQSSCQNTSWANCFRNIINVSNSLDPNSFVPNCLQMLSVEKTLARVKRSCQKF